MLSGTQNWSILASAASISRKGWEGRSAGRPPTLPPKFWWKVSTMPSWWTCGPWEWPSTPCSQQKCHSKETPKREGPGSSPASGSPKISLVRGCSNCWTASSYSPRVAFCSLMSKTVNFCRRTPSKSLLSSTPERNFWSPRTTCSTF